MLFVFFQCMHFWYAEDVSGATSDHKLCIEVWIVNILCISGTGPLLFYLCILYCLLWVCVHIYRGLECGQKSSRLVTYADISAIP